MGSWLHWGSSTQTPGKADQTVRGLEGSAAIQSGNRPRSQGIVVRCGESSGEARVPGRCTWQMHKTDKQALPRWG